MRDFERCTGFNNVQWRERWRHSRAAPGSRSLPTHDEMFVLRLRSGRIALETGVLTRIHTHTQVTTPTGRKGTHTRGTLSALPVSQLKLVAVARSRLLEESREKGRNIFPLLGPYVASPSGSCFSMVCVLGEFSPSSSHHYRHCRCQYREHLLYSLLGHLDLCRINILCYNSPRGSAEMVLILPTILIICPSAQHPLL